MPQDHSPAGQGDPQAEIIVLGCFAARETHATAALPGVVEVVADKRDLPKLLGPAGIERRAQRHAPHPSLPPLHPISPPPPPYLPSPHSPPPLSLSLSLLSGIRPRPSRASPPSPSFPPLDHAGQGGGGVRRPRAKQPSTMISACGCPWPAGE